MRCKLSSTDLSEDSNKRCISRAIQSEAYFTLTVHFFPVCVWEGVKSSRLWEFFFRCSVRVQHLDLHGKCKWGYHDAHAENHLPLPDSYLQRHTEFDRNGCYLAALVVRHRNFYRRYQRLPASCFFHSFFSAPGTVFRTPAANFFPRTTSENATNRREHQNDFASLCTFPFVCFVPLLDSAETELNGCTQHSHGCKIIHSIESAFNRCTPAASVYAVQPTLKAFSFYFCFMFY